MPEFTPCLRSALRIREAGCKHLICSGPTAIWPDGGVNRNNQYKQGPEFLEEDGASCASSEVQGYLTPRVHRPFASPGQLHSARVDVSAPYISPDEESMSSSRQDQGNDDGCSEACSCCMSGRHEAGQKNSSMRSTQTAPSLDSDSQSGLRSRSRSNGALPGTYARRQARLPHHSLVMPPLNVVLRRPIIDRVARYRSASIILTCQAL